MNLEELRDYKEMLEADMEHTTMLLVEVNAEIARLSALESQNEYWLPSGMQGVFHLVPMTEVQDEMLAGTRAEVYYAKTQDIFNHMFFATITDDVSPEAHAHYVAASGKHFGTIVAFGGYNRGPVHAQCYDNNGVPIPDVYIPYGGEAGEHGSTVALREYWQSGACIGRHRYLARFQMSQIDREYRWATIRGTTTQFMEKYPAYEPE